VVKRRLTLITGNETASEQAPPQSETENERPVSLRQQELKMHCLTLRGVEVHEKRMVSFLFKASDLEKHRGGIAALVRDLGDVADRVSRVHLSVKNSEPVVFNVTIGVCREANDDPSTDLRLIFGLSAPFEKVVPNANYIDIWFDFREPTESLDDVVNRYLGLDD